MTIKPDDRRLHQRFKLDPMHAAVTVQSVDRLAIGQLQGHAYDISESGVRMELDEPLERGQHVAMYLALPGQSTEIFVAGEVVWVNDADDDPGPRRMAIHFTSFVNESDKARFLAYTGSCADRLAA